MVNWTQFPFIIRPIATQGPSISTSRALGSPLLSKRPSHHRQGAILNNHISCILRTRYRPRIQGNRHPALRCHIFRDIARDEASSALQIGVLGQQYIYTPRGSRTEAYRSFRSGKSQGSRRFPLRPTDHPNGKIPKLGGKHAYLNFPWSAIVHEHLTSDPSSRGYPALGGVDLIARRLNPAPT